MPTPLTPQELVLMQQETDYLDINIPTYQSVVINWQGSSILIFSSANDGYIATDITDLGSSVISQLSNIGPTTPTVWGTITNLPQAVADTVASEANTAISAAKTAGAGASSIAQAVSDAVGKALANLGGPLISTLTPIIAIVAIGLLLIYLPKKG
jgi:hypothetical protein